MFQKLKELVSGYFLAFHKIEQDIVCWYLALVFFATFPICAVIVMLVSQVAWLGLIFLTTLSHGQDRNPRTSVKIHQPGTSWGTHNTLSYRDVPSLSLIGPTSVTDRTNRWSNIESFQQLSQTISFTRDLNELSDLEKFILANA